MQSYGIGTIYEILFFSDFYMILKTNPISELHASSNIMENFEGTPTQFQKSTQN